MSYLLCLIEQGLGSLLNIGLNIWLIRANGSDVYGIYSFWFNMTLLAGSVQNGLTISHLTPLAPGAGILPRRIGAERALLAMSVALVVLSALIVGGVFAIAPGHSDLALSGAIAMVPAYLAYQYARALAFSRGALLTATLATAAVVVVIIAGLGFDKILLDADSANPVLWIIALAYGIAASVTTFHLASGLQLRWHHLRQYLPYFRRSRWTLLGVVCFELMNRLPSFAVTFLLGAPALGRMSATQIPERPPILLVAALQPALRNDLAIMREHAAWRRFVVHTLRGAAAALAVNVVWAIPVALAWPFLARILFHGRFADDLALGMLWAASQALGSLAGVVATSFQVCGAFRLIGYADIAAAVGTVVGLLVLLPVFGIPGAILSTIVGQFAYVAVTILLWPRLRTEFHASVPAPEEIFITQPQ
jgi:O-antigen/teichoic acid export membrane protein